MPPRPSTLKISYPGTDGNPAWSALLAPASVTVFGRASTVSCPDTGSGGESELAPFTGDSGLGYESDTSTTSCWGWSVRRIRLNARSDNENTLQSRHRLACPPGASSLVCPNRCHLNQPTADPG